MGSDNFVILDIYSFFADVHVGTADIVKRENYGTVGGQTALDDKIIGLLFSASWCPPCLHFLPMLREVYDQLKERDSPFEIVFISLDKTKDDMMEYFKEKHGNWLAAKYDDPLKEVLLEKYKISVIPKLIIIRPDGEVISNTGRKDIQDKGIIAFRSWQSAMLAAAKKLDQHQQLMNELEGKSTITEMSTQ